MAPDRCRYGAPGRRLTRPNGTGITVGIVTEALSDFQSQIASVLTRLQAQGIIADLAVRPGALRSPRLADMLFDLYGDEMLVMVADHAPETVRIVGRCREVDVAPEALEATLRTWGKD